MRNVSLTYHIVHGGVVGAGQEVGEEVDHHETFLLRLRGKKKRTG